MSRAATPALVFTRTEKTHGDVRALGPIDLTIRSGEAVALLGHNGSGKSTLLGIAAGALDPTDGSVSVGGAEAGSDEARAAVSYVRDHPVLYEDISVRDHLDYLTRLHGSDPETEGVEVVLERLGLAHRADEVPGSLSRGLRQKAGLAIAFSRPFDVLLIDEPFAGLDPDGKRALVDLITSAREVGAACIVATHDLVMADRFTRALVLQEGTVVFDGSPEDLADAGGESWTAET